MKKSLLILTLLYHCTLSFALSDKTIAGVVFTDTDGDNYYEVSSKAHLIAMSMESESVMYLKFKQTVDIIFNEDPTKEDWNGDGLINEDDSIGFLPIGKLDWEYDDEGKYIKEYDGNDKVIKNLYIDNDTFTYVGLFSVIRYESEYTRSIIHNTHLVDCNITSKSYSGGLVGCLSGAEVSDNTVSGHISGVRAYDGIVGYPYLCSISNCVSTAYLSLSDITIGGVVFTEAGDDADGDDYYAVSSKSHLIAMSLEPQSIIGLQFKQTVDIIFNEDSSKEDWNGDGLINGDDSTGFMPIGQGIGSYSGHIKEYDGNGKVIKNLYIDNNTLTYVGLFSTIYYGYYSNDDSPAIILNTHLVDCNISSKSYSGGLVGYLRGGGLRDNTVSGYISGDISSEGIVGDGSRYYLRNCVSTAYLGGFADITIGSVVFTDADGDGYYDVLSKQHLIAMSTASDSIVGLRFKQTANIIFDEDPTKEDWNGDGRIDDNDSCGFIPIGTQSDTNIDCIREYNGNGKMIKNLYINSDTLTYVGLFSIIEPSDEYYTQNTIYNTHLVDCNISSKSYAGGLAGYIHGAKISNSTVSGYISGNNLSGGIAGFVYGYDISNCVISAYSAYGGIAGTRKYSNYERIENCISKGRTNRYGMLDNSYIAPSSGNMVTGHLQNIVPWRSSSLSYFDQQTTGVFLDPSDYRGETLTNTFFNDTLDLDYGYNDEAPWVLSKYGRPYLYFQKVAIGNSTINNDGYIDVYIEKNPLDSVIITRTGIRYLEDGQKKWEEYEVDIKNRERIKVLNLDSTITYYVQAFAEDANGWKYYGDMVKTNKQTISYFCLDENNTVHQFKENVGCYHHFKFDELLTPYDSIVAWSTVPNVQSESDYVKGDSVLIENEDVSLYARSVKRKYTIAYNSNGGLNNMPTQTFLYQENVTLLSSTFEKQGYKLNSWNTKTDGNGDVFDQQHTFLMPDSSFTLYAQWEIDGHTITYYPNGGQGTMNTILLGVGMDTTLTISAFSKSGYQFSGWNTQADGLGLSLADGDIITMGDSDIPLYAQWTALNYKINFYSNGGSGFMPSQNTTYGDEVILSETTFSRLGYSFKDWNTDVNGLGQRYVDKGALTTGVGDVTLYAQWATVPYTISYINCELASNANPATYTVESPDIVLAHAIQRGKAFNGWFLDSLLTTPIVELPQGGSGDKVLYASWSTEYNVVYYSNGGTGQTNMAKLTAVGTDYTTKDNIFARSGYTFDKWNTLPDGTGTTYGESQDITLADDIDFALYAIWKPIVYQIDYENTRGASNYNLDQYSPQTTTFILENLSTTGYTFVGWYADSLYHTPVPFIPQGSIGDTILYASWAINSYAIKYYSNGGLENTIVNTFDYGTDTTLLISPFSRKGYRFTGWNTTPSGSGTSYQDKAAISMGENDLVLYAQWAMEEYSIAYHNLLGCLNTNAISYTVFTPTAELNPLEKVGYTFGGWFLDPSFQNQSNTIALGDTGHVSLYAHWELNTYKINYNANGANGVMSPNTISFGKDSTLSANQFRRNGYRFSHWNTEADNSGDIYIVEQGITMLDNDLTLYAQWELVEYSIAYHNLQGTNNINAREYNVITSQTLTPLAKIGSTFWGWFIDENFINQKNDIAQGDTGNLDLYAKWELNKYPIAYNKNGGIGTMSMQNVAYGVDTFLLANAYQRKGYLFTHWNSEADNSGVDYSDKASVLMGDKSITLNAQWELQNYSVNYYDTRSVANTNPREYNVISEETTLSDLALEGYAFMGWYNDDKYTTKISSIEKGDTGHMNLYAKFELNEYQISYKKNGGIGAMPSQSVNFEADISLLANAYQRMGYEFSHWNTEADNSGVDYLNKQAIKMSSNNLVLYAQWNLLNYDISYHNLMGAASSHPRSYNTTQSVLLAPLVKEGYDFLGWYANEGFTDLKNAISLGDAGDISLYAKWEINSFAVEINNGGFGFVKVDNADAEAHDINVDYGDALTVIHALNYAGDSYLFKGWSDGVKANPRSLNSITSDTTISALWEKPINIVIRDTVKVYDGLVQELSVLLDDNVDYIVEYKDENALRFSDQKPLYAGRYDVRVTITGNGVYGEKEAKFIINRKPVTVTVEDGQTKEYGDSEPDSLVYNVTGLLAGDYIFGELDRTLGEGPGYYPITLGSIEAATPDMAGDMTIIPNNESNYEISFEGADFFIDSNIEIYCKWEYMLIVDNCDNAFASYQWYKDGSPIVGATSQSFYNEEHTLCGMYQCEVSYIGSSHKILTEPVTYAYCTAVQSRSLSVYPNPVEAEHWLSIELPQSLKHEGLDMRLYSQNGSLLESRFSFEDDKLILQAPSMVGLYKVIVTNDSEIVIANTVLVR